ncbi:extracellular solute-binding protein [Paraliobacillus sp. JSM ZJ581]|uniref:extracellular solute-binding protein n=1 Tax=Paraliobacillus sp. JSM ZJ581 TaxID=3342118 RepID=UPI0035A92E2C
MKSKVFLWSFIALLILPLTIVKADDTLDTESAKQFNEPRYHQMIDEWKKKGIDSVAPLEYAINPSSFLGTTSEWVDQTDSDGYGSDVINWRDNNKVTFEVEVEQEGLYEIGFDYYPLGDAIVPIEGAIQVNGQYPFSESRQIVFPIDWKNETKEFDVDRFGHEVIPKQVPIEAWHHMKVEDSSHLYTRPLTFHLNEGKNTISLINLRGSTLLGKAYVTAPEQVPSYQEYIDQYSSAEKINDIKIQEAEQPLKKNSSYIRPESTEDPSVYPYDSNKLYLNTYGGDSWSTPGQQVDWEVNVKKAGLYRISFKVYQGNDSGDPVFRSVSINGEVPFKEVEQYRFPQKNEWYNETFSGEEDKPYLFYLEEGSNLISLKADISKNNRVIFAIDDVMKRIEEISLSIRKLTGNQQDHSRDWDISEYLPEIEEDLMSWAQTLNKEADYLLTLSGGVKTTNVVSLQIAAEKLQALADKPDEIPNRMTELSEGSNSAAQMLGTAMTSIQKNPLLVDRFYLHGDKSIPKAEVGFFPKIKNWATQFFQSFTKENLATSEVKEETVEVWVNRPRQYVELLQHMTDQNFTTETGIKVKYSIMPDEQKLILANAAGSQPDLALGISNWLPYELSIRGAAADLRQFEDFSEVGRKFSPGAFLPLIVDDSIYALPETQDFYVQYYRRDILETLDVPVPNTWEDVTEILPELQRYGMNYYTPIAGAVAFKPFQTTAPFIYQFGGTLYEEDGIGTTIDSESSLAGIQFMTDLNTIYSTPLQVPNFYNHFRYSTLPIGIAEFGTYVQLTSAAPEISGWWDIAPHPGIEQEDGTIERWATGSGQSGMIFKGSDKKEPAWEVLKWWMSTETQTEFATTLQTLYGPEYMWNTANLDSFAQLPWPQEHKDVILQQWEYLREVPKAPYAYMVEREISNIWNQVVFDGENTRSATDDSVITIDREMRRKLEEFDYMKDGKVLKPYQIPTIEQVEGWLGVDEN